MAIGDMRRLMGDNALQHRSTAHFVDQPVMDEYCVIADHKSIERAVIDHKDLDPLRAQPCRAQHRRAQLFERVFHIRIAQQTYGLCRQRKQANHQQGGY